MEMTISKQGYRLSGARKRLLSLLESSAQPLTQAALFEKLRSDGSPVGLVTIYRNLDLLSRLGLVERIYNENGELGYLACRSHGHHHHMLCRACQNTVEFEAANDLDEMIKRVESSTGYQIQDHILQFMGLCPDCRAQEAA
mgnify:CR=1 FL=1